MEYYNNPLNNLNNFKIADKTVKLSNLNSLK